MLHASVMHFDGREFAYTCVSLVRGVASGMKDFRSGLYGEYDDGGGRVCAEESDAFCGGVKGAVADSFGVDAAGACWRCAACGGVRCDGAEADWDGECPADRDVDGRACDCGCRGACSAGAGATWASAGVCGLAACSA